MPRLPQQKVGIVACSGEELAEGTVARLAALKVLHELRPGRTVTICLPLFLAGGEGDRAFARFHPTITVDGCELRCAARGTEMYSGKPAASVVVSELAAERGLTKPEGRRRLDEAGQRLVDMTAQDVAMLVDGLLGTEGRVADITAGTETSLQTSAGAATCSCGSGVPVTKLLIDGRSVEMVALLLIFQQFREAGRRLDDAAARQELLEAVKVYNHVPPGTEDSYRDAISREYGAFCEREPSQ